MLYLINCDVVKNYYLNNKKTINMNHIVDAESEEDAEKKVIDYYDKKNEEYYVSHYVNLNYCNEIIT